MGSFRHAVSNVVVTVDDSKDYRYTAPEWESVSDDKPAPRPKKAAPAKSDQK